MSEPENLSCVWQALAFPGLEHLELRRHAGGWRVDSTVVALEEGKPFSLHYTLTLNADWRATEMHLEQTDGQALRLLSPASGAWIDGEGRPLPELDSCDSLDITATPFTNTLATRLLRLGVGQTGLTRAAWVQVPGLELLVSQQRYTRLSEQSYRFEALDSGFTADLTVDTSELVTHYPGLFQRLL